ncbi:hypothetical protein [Paraflavitalea pollutisoli]|uniref:hypothetical protein n=1 Tax=Paraflavitalea pollutisoli TaxID=3034143 RepID=UPI0023EB7962|nr:hypothetical protein [Paraflavitalea sp. H1-2-19X]
MKSVKKIPPNMSDTETKDFLKQVAQTFAGVNHFPEKTALAREILKNTKFPPIPKPKA